MKKFSRALTGQTLKIFWQHAKQYPLYVLIIAGSIFFANILDVYKPFIMKRLFDLLAKGGLNEYSLLVKTLWMLFFLNLLNWGLYRIAGLVNTFFQARVMSNLLNTCYAYLQKHSVSFFDNSFVGSLVRRITRYASAFETIADQLTWEVGRVVIRIGGILAVLIWYKPTLGLAALVWAFVYVTIMYKFARYKLKYDIKSAEVDTEVTRHVADTITNHYNLKIFAAINREVKAFGQITEKLFQIRRFRWNLDELVNAIQGLMILGLEIGSLFYALKLWRAGLFTVGDFVLLQTYLIQIFDHLWGIGRNIRKTYEALADADEMTEILLAPIGVKDIPGASKLKVRSGRVDFTGVNFGYQGRNVFKNFNLSIKPGEKVALVGPSGGGKTTYTKLLFRFYDIGSGSICIDGQDISTVTQDSLREGLTLVPQEPILFHRSLLENIRYARPSASLKEVVIASKLAYAHNFIDKLPEKYETFVGERGVKLSGGERQRVAIARAILKNAPILVMDEATSALDSESEFLIQEAMKTLMGGKTVIAIAHRLSTIMQMDRIVVIDGGRIVEQGRHEELLKIKTGIYQKLWGIQSGGFA
jgi:ATP-binding cassette subfamily B protein